MTGTLVTLAWLLYAAMVIRLVMLLFRPGMPVGASDPAATRASRRIGLLSRVSAGHGTSPTAISAPGRSGPATKDAPTPRAPATRPGDGVLVLGGRPHDLSAGRDAAGRHLAWLGDVVAQRAGTADGSLGGYRCVVHAGHTTDSVFGALQDSASASVPLLLPARGQP